MAEIATAQAVLGAATGVASTVGQIQQQEAAQKTQAAQLALERAQKERTYQQQLQQQLARQNNAAAARGVQASTGSAAQIQQAATQRTADQLTQLNSLYELDRRQGRSRAGQYGSLGQDLLSLGNRISRL